MVRIPGSVLVFLTLVQAACLLRAGTLDPQAGVADPDGKTLWYDCQLLGVEGKGWTNTAAYYDRLPASASGTVPAAVWGLSHDSAGLAVRFVTDAAAIQVRWTVLKSGLAMPHMPATGVSGVDLYSRNDAGKWRFLANGRPTQQEANRASFSLIAGKENILYLPLYNGVKSIEIGVPKEKTLSTPPQAPGQPRKPIVFYGTSITQGGCASRPGLAATAIIGRELDVPVINLGFSGSGKMEPVMADLVAELDPAIFVLDCLWNMSAELVTERTEPFVRKLRTAHPATPILLVEDSSFRNVPTGKGNILRTIYGKLVKDGIKDLHLLSNDGMLGDDFEGTVDGCHPNDLGMMRQATVFVKALRPLLPPAAAQP